jgi:hypothetical protein
MVTGMLASAVHITMPNLTPDGVSPHRALLSFAMASALMGLALTPLARGTGGKRAARALAFAVLLLICLGANSAIEIVMFTTLLTSRTAWSFVAGTVLPALLLGGSLALLGDRVTDAPTIAQRVRAHFSGHSVESWTWRFALGILAFPAIYFVFGAMVSPFVVPAYQAGVARLVLPPLSTIMPVQILRSALFLAASLPFLVWWKGTRASLVVSLGLAHWFLVGLFGLLQFSILPATLRVAHSIEIGADSFTYAASLVLLLVPVAPWKPLSEPVAVR